MIFVTGPLFAGKKEYVCQALGWSEEDLSQKAAWDVQDLAAQAEDLEALADDLSAKYPVLIATEVGGGVVPVDAGQRAAREAAGRLACLLAAGAMVIAGSLLGGTQFQFYPTLSGPLTAPFSLGVFAAFSPENYTSTVDENAFNKAAASTANVCSEIFSPRDNI